MLPAWYEHIKCRRILGNLQDDGRAQSGITGG